MTAPKSKAPRAMQCPKCKGKMSPQATAAGSVERCSDCNGLWFDRLEDEAQRAFAAALDVGDAARGERFNKVDRISCPKCANTPLLRMVDNDQPHIWFEACSSCNGRFFDAGEFRDLSQKSLSDILKRLRATGRGT
jgi:Zn-finger nucleic acid-binding protein